MIKYNTLLRVVYTLGVYIILAQSASAQSVLNFAKVAANERLNAGFAVTNPTSNYADVTFTLYGSDGNPVSSGLVNPVRYRVAPKSQVSMDASEIFAAAKLEGWVQATSPTTGLTGYYLAGNLATTLEGADSALALLEQVVPIPRNDQTTTTELVILNPGPITSSVAINLYNEDGASAGTLPARILPPHGALRLSSADLSNPTGTVAARITSSAPVAATAVINRADSLLFTSGQTVDSRDAATVRVVPQFLAGGGFNSILLLTNPTSSPVQATITLLNETGPISVRTFNIAASGSLTANIQTIMGRLIAPSVNGWLRIESPNVPLAGVLIVDQGRAMTSVPVQSVALQRMLYPQISEGSGMYTGLALVNPSRSDADVEITLVHTDGTTFAKKSLTIPADSKYVTMVHDVLPQAAGQASGYFLVRSSTPLYGVGMLGALDIAGMPPVRIPDSFTPNDNALSPTITLIEPGSDVQPGMQLRVSVANLSGEPAFFLGGQQLTAVLQAPGIARYLVDVPNVEAGFANLIVRTKDGRESAPKVLQVVSPDPTQILSGKAYYQKIDVKDSGLDLTHPVMVPVRNARVEVFSRSTQTIVAVSETDRLGRFDIPVPLDPNLTVRIVSRLRSSGLRVADNTNLNVPYVISKDFDGRDPDADLLLSDTTRVSGAFNILEMVQRSNDTLKVADPSLVPPGPVIFWSTRNRRGSGSIAQGFVGTTYFNIANNTAYVLGDRGEDSDEFDDAVIIHEYAHLLAAKFSRDDSPGGTHILGDALDPRVAWSEGWANFFSSVVRNDAIWRDSMGTNGVNILRYNLEDNVPAGDDPGYWSEASVDTLLWDLYDADGDDADNVQYPISAIWAAFSDLKNNRFVYLPYFLEHFIDNNPAAADAVAAMVRARTVEFQPNERPSVTYPFPTAFVGSSMMGFVDSLTKRRNNLTTSSHFYSFTTAGGAASIRLEILGLGPGDTATGNDLDLFLMDANGRLLDRSDRGLNGQSELIAEPRLSAGTYVVEIRSFYTKAETGGFVFNSGQYRLSISVQ